MTSNAITGIGKGVTAMVAGIGAGAAAVVVAPVAGAKSGADKGGFLGAMTGLGGGLVTGIVGLTVGVVGGTAMGGFQIVKGFIDTPGAIAAFARDDDLHGRETIDLSQVEAIEASEKDWDERAQAKVQNASLDAEQPEYVPRADVKDRTYYELLGAEPNAAAGVLKRKYYGLARQEHPDKGGDMAKFQKIGEAYAVLSDPEKRKKYDEEGLEGLKDANQTDPGIVFAMLFGERKFVDYCGELTTVLQMRLADDPQFASKELQAKELQRLQNERVTQLAKKLALRLDRWLEDPEGFLTEQLGVVAELLKVNLGPQMCTAVGIMYEITAEAKLGAKGKLAQLGFHAPDEAFHAMATTSRMVGALQQLQKEKGKSAEEQQQGRSKVEQSMFDMMALDIESSVGAAAKLCLSDSSVDKETRRNRARGLLKLGLIFQGKLPAVQTAAAAPLPKAAPAAAPEAVPLS